MRVDELLKHLNRFSEVREKELVAALNARKKDELEFHDIHRDIRAAEKLDPDTHERFYSNKKYYSATADSKEYTDSWIRKNAPGRVFLDYACGNGVNAIKAAKAGAKLAIGIDLSKVSLDNAEASASREGVSKKTKFILSDAESTVLPDNSVDAVICSGMLHHLDLSYAFPELRRIMTPEGILLAVEALGYNPGIKLYRLLTPQMRTKWEMRHILNMADLNFAKRFFKLGELRYWHIVGIASPHVQPLAPMLQAIDRFLTRLPIVQLLAWIFTFELIKPSE